MQRGAPSTNGSLNAGYNANSRIRFFLPANGFPAMYARPMSIPRPTLPRYLAAPTISPTLSAGPTANRRYTGQTGEYRYRLLDHLKTNRIDVVVTPHLFPAQTLTCLRYEGLLTQRFIGVATDYACIPFFWGRNPDGFFHHPPSRFNGGIHQKGHTPRDFEALWHPGQKGLSAEAGPTPCETQAGAGSRPSP